MTVFFTTSDENNANLLNAHYFKGTYIYFDKLFQFVLILESKQSGLRDDLFNRPGQILWIRRTKKKNFEFKNPARSPPPINVDRQKTGMSKLHECIFELLCLYGPLSKITLS